jgi:hypothetical protein
MQHDTQERAQATFYPYGSARDDVAPDDAAPDSVARKARSYVGAVEIEDADGRAGLETYFLERHGEHWVLRSQLPEAAPRLLARVSAARLPAEPLDAATELLIDLWTLRQPGRLRFLRALDAGELGPLRWRRVLAGIPQRPPLEHALRSEGLAVTTAPGPIGTTEHILLLRRA